MVCCRVNFTSHRARCRIGKTGTKPSKVADQTVPYIKHYTNRATSTLNYISVRGGYLIRIIHCIGKKWYILSVRHSYGQKKHVVKEQTQLHNTHLTTTITTSANCLQFDAQSLRLQQRLCTRSNVAYCMHVTFRVPLGLHMPNCEPDRQAKFSSLQSAMKFQFYDFFFNGKPIQDF